MEDERFELNLIDVGVQDIQNDEEGMTIFTKIEDLQKVKKFLEEKEIETESAEIEYVAKEEMNLSGEDKEKVRGFVEALEDNEDVADYYTNVNI
jgi:transcriptional/translational regulatory protein YebC/TACO1